MAQKYDIVVFGATGDTGRCVCHFLYNQGKLLGIESWAPAARNLKKLEKLLGDVVSPTGSPGSQDGVVASPAIKADSGEYSSMLDMALQAKVVVACAGPFADYGESCVKACVEAGANYVDITGETPWVNLMAKKYGEEAIAKGISVISQAAYDSVPSDITVALAARALQEKGEQISHVETHHKLKGGAAPVGTLNTALKAPMAMRRKFLEKLTGGLMAAEKNKEKKKEVLSLVNRTGLVPKVAEKAISKDVQENFLNPYSALSGKFSFPGFMAVVNTPIVHTTAIALDYGVDKNKSFTYRERLGANDADISTLYGLIPFAGFLVALFLGVLIAGPPLFVVFMVAPDIILNYIKGFASHEAGGAKEKCFKKLFKNNGFNPNGLVSVLALASSKTGKKARVSFESNYDAGLGFTALSAVTVAAALLQPEGAANYGQGFQTAVAAVGPENLQAWYDKVNVKIRVSCD